MVSFNVRANALLRNVKVEILMVIDIFVHHTGFYSRR